METGTTKRYKIRQIKPEEVYVSILTGRLVQNEEGWTRMEPIKREIRPSGSMLIDVLVDVLMHTRYRLPLFVAELMEVDRLELSISIHLLTGLTLREFIEQYRLLEAKEYLSCTSLSLKEVAIRCGFASQTTFGQHFQAAVKMTPGLYRRYNRPKDYQLQYRWE